MNWAQRIVLLFSFIFLAAAPCAWAAMPAAPEGRVSDFAGILSEKTKTQLNVLLVHIEKSTSAEIAVVTVSSLEGMSVEEYAVTLFKNWGIGKKGKDNGVLFLVAPNERKVRIEVGYGLEPVITDGQAGSIIREIVLPAFKKGDYDQGILQGCIQLMALITGKGTAPEIEPTSHTEAEEPWTVKVGIMLFFSLFITLGFLALGSALRQKGQGFFLIWGAGFGGIPLAMSIIFALVIGFPVYILPALAAFMLIIGMRYGKKFFSSALVSGASLSVGGRTYSSGGSSFGGFSGGSSFGGFSGGSSGGGGASGSW